MIAKEIALPPNSVVSGEGAPSKVLVIVAIINRIIRLFVVNAIENLPGHLFEFNVFCDFFIQFFS